MSTTSPDASPDVAAFVLDVRALLADLPEDAQDELLDGLEADLAEQVAETGPDVLGDATAYAAELRAAAGLPARSRSISLPDVSFSAVWDALDGARRRVCGLAHAHPALAVALSVLESLRPAWWVLRAWIAVTALDQATGAHERVTLVPHLDVFGLGPALLAIAVVVSVLVGQQRLWPGSASSRRPWSRAVLIALDVVALLLPFSFAFSVDTYNEPGFSAGYQRATNDRAAGLSVRGRLVTNLFAYDLSGNPIEGVQLFDQDGRPVALSTEQSIAGSGAQRTVGCPWFNGTIALRQVFPLQQQVQRGQVCGAGKDAAHPIQAPAFPLAQVPPVTRAPSS